MNQVTDDPPLRLPLRRSTDHKGSFGRVLLIGGSRGMAGSIALSSIAALHAGSGLVAAAIPDPILDTVAGFHPAIMTLPLADDRGQFAVGAWDDVAHSISKQDAIGCGPGMGTGSGSVRLVDRLLDHRRCPLVLDADALNVIAQESWIHSGRLDLQNSQLLPMIWTPHPGELERLCGVSPKNHDLQVESAMETSLRTGVVIVLKGGPAKVIGRSSIQSEVHVWTNTTGNPGMATGGSGDVLTGILTSLLGQGLDAWDAARLGVWLHGLAGDRAAQEFSMTSMTAWELLQSLRYCAREIESH